MRRQILKVGATTAAGICMPAIVSAVAQQKHKLKIINSASNTVQTMQEMVKKLGRFDELGI